MLAHTHTHTYEHMCFTNTYDILKTMSLIILLLWTGIQINDSGYAYIHAYQCIPMCAVMYVELKPCVTISHVLSLQIYSCASFLHCSQLWSLSFFPSFPFFSVPSLDALQEVTCID